MKLGSMVIPLPGPLGTRTTPFSHVSDDVSQWRRVELISRPVFSGYFSTCTLLNSVISAA